MFSPTKYRKTSSLCIFFLILTSTLFWRLCVSQSNNSDDLTRFSFNIQDIFIMAQTKPRSQSIWWDETQCMNKNIKILTRANFTFKCDLTRKHLLGRMRQKVRKEWVTKKFHSGCRDTREWITSLWLIRSNRSNLWASQTKKLTTWGCVRHISQSEHENDKSCQGDVYFERTNSLNQLVCKSQYLPRRVASSVLSEWQDFECLA